MECELGYANKGNTSFKLSLTKVLGRSWGRRWGGTGVVLGAKYFK